ncbi:MAG: cytochrome ubiquinol oxidase subunit I, partial [Gammaproteobacteria bacterium]
FSALCWIFGFMLAFFPLYALGIMGLPRRTVAYSQPAYVPLEMVAFAGALLLAVALAALVIQLWVSIKHRDENRVYVGDPWDGRSLEWAVSAPPPEYNFPVIPVVNDRDAFTAAKEFGKGYQQPDEYVDIKMPQNAAMGPVIGALGFTIAFGLVWHIWWLVILAALAVAVTMIVRGFARNITKVVPAEDVRQLHRHWLDVVATTTAISRADERAPANQGLAEVEPVTAEATP